MGRNGFDDIGKIGRIVIVLVEHGAVGKSAGFDPLLEELELGTLRRFTVGEGPQVVDMTKNALEPDVSGFRWPRDNDPHRTRSLPQFSDGEPLKFRAT